MILFCIYVVPLIKPWSILQSYELLLYGGEKPRCLQLPSGKAHPGEHQNSFPSPLQAFYLEPYVLEEVEVLGMLADGEPGVVHVLGLSKGSALESWLS